MSTCPSMIEIHDADGRVIAEAEGFAAAKSAAEYLLTSGEEQAPLRLVNPKHGPRATDPTAHLSDTSYSGIRWVLTQGTRLR